ncbi:hypothetical protein EP073_12385 [Geovibrio thiophilus]|uniref:Uncharacterized protein n=1 Tax=Geovibrio thiophilus TaxID=139438 RepID=A0A410K198_9BACT|nr:hypothetical protein [Geovibrio thiophilus]QAR34174.1 hypothetical protein EP073_12385 [Geovibrio thiophilus]
MGLLTTIGGMLLMAVVMGLISVYLYSNVLLICRLCRRLCSFEPDKYTAFRKITLTAGGIYVAGATAAHYFKKHYAGEDISEYAVKGVMFLTFFLLIPVGGWIYGRSFSREENGVPIGFGKGLTIFAAHFAYVIAVVIPITIVTVHFSL